MAGSTEVRDRALVAGSQHDELRVEPVRDPGPFGQALVPGVHEELEVLGDAGHRDRAETRLPERHPCDREGVARIAFTGATEVPALTLGEDGGHLDDHLPGADEEPGKDRSVGT